MQEVELTAVCSAVKKLFRGARDDWGHRTEAAFELCEKLEKELPCAIVVVDSDCTVNEFVRNVRERFGDILDGDAMEYLRQNFGNVVLLL